jgi:hypothetical protein
MGRSGSYDQTPRKQRLGWCGHTEWMEEVLPKTFLSWSTQGESERCVEGKIERTRSRRTRQTRQPKNWEHIYYVHIRYSSPGLILLQKIPDVNRVASWESRFSLCVLICRGYMITNFVSFRCLFQCSNVGSKHFIFLTLNEYVGFKIFTIFVYFISLLMWSLTLETRQQLPAKRWCQRITVYEVTTQNAKPGYSL